MGSEMQYCRYQGKYIIQLSPDNKDDFSEVN